MGVFGMARSVIGVALTLCVLAGSASANNSPINFVHPNAEDLVPELTDPNSDFIGSLADEIAETPDMVLQEDFSLESKINAAVEGKGISLLTTGAGSGAGSGEDFHPCSEICTHNGLTCEDDCGQVCTAAFDDTCRKCASDHGCDHCLQCHEAAHDYVDHNEEHVAGAGSGAPAATEAEAEAGGVTVEYTITQDLTFAEEITDAVFAILGPVLEVSYAMAAGAYRNGAYAAGSSCTATKRRSTSLLQANSGAVPETEFVEESALSSSAASTTVAMQLTTEDEAVSRHSPTAATVTDKISEAATAVHAPSVANLKVASASQAQVTTKKVDKSSAPSSFQPTLVAACVVFMTALYLQRE